MQFEAGLRIGFMLLAELTWPEIDALDRDTPVVFPVAALEQHGRHMPLFTDSLLTNELVRRAESRLGDRVLFAPLMWLGNSHHHLDFPGTLSAEPRVYIDLLNGLMENFISHGFRRLVFLNGHGGNDVPGKQAVFETRQKHRDRADLLLLLATYWNLGAKPWETDLTIQQRGMGHACEWETSMIQYLHPQLVRDRSELQEIPFGNPFAPAARGWIMKDRSDAGHVGDPTIATPEKGEVLLKSFEDEVVRFLERVVAWDGQSWNG